MPLFTEILQLKVEYTPFDMVQTNEEKFSSEYPTWLKFVTAILLKPLKQGGQINRYISEFTTAPYYIRRLIEKRGNNYYLKTADVQSAEYIFAVFSLMQLMNDENGKLLELKMRELERRHKTE